MQTVVLDNGAGLLKIGFGGRKKPELVMPNTVVEHKKEKKKYIGNQQDQCLDISNLWYKSPFDRGYPVNWDTEKEIWNYAFRELRQQKTAASMREYGLLLTQPYFMSNFPPLQRAIYEIVYEDFGFSSLFLAHAPDLALFHYKHENPHSVFATEPAHLVIDSGHSFTHIVPFFDNHPIVHGIRRINLGGKALTNHLKEIISYRAIDMRNDFLLVNLIKERLCFVAEDYQAAMATTRRRGKENTIRREYILPDYETTARGYVRGEPGDPALEAPAAATEGPGGHKQECAEAMDTTDEKREGKPAGAINTAQQQVLVMNNERFEVPEALFRPYDIGVPQQGIPEAVVGVIGQCPSDLRAALFANILVIGGNVKFPGFTQRLYSEVRAMAPALNEVNILVPKDPITCAWSGGSALSQTNEYMRLAVTKKEYDEHGAVICDRRFFT